MWKTRLLKKELMMLDIYIDANLLCLPTENMIPAKPAGVPHFFTGH